MNAREELIKLVSNKIKCAQIQYGYDWGNQEQTHFVLKVGYSDEEYEQFLKSLDFNYDNGYGGQQLFGIVWFEDGTWLERGEYDGSEWWEHKILPPIPDELLKDKS